ncbi:MAG: hypothetical protein ABEJ23_01130 [Haloarculaceae archaeon]
MGTTITHDGEQYPITDETTAADLKEDLGVDEDRRLSYRGEEGTEVLNDSDVVADHVDDGQVISTVPLNEGRMFG